MIQQAIEAPAAEAGLALYIERDALHGALQLLRRIVERRNTIPILDHLLFAPLADASGVAITATDLDVQLTLHLPGTWEGTGRFCLPAFTLADMVKKAETGAHIELRLCGGRMEMIHGRSRGKLEVQPADDFPTIADRDGDSPVRFTMPAAQFGSDLARVAWAQGKEEVRYYMIGTALQRHADGLNLVASDGHNLAVVNRFAPAESDGMPDVILPTKAGDILQRLIKASGGVEEALQLAITPATEAAGGSRPLIVAELAAGRLVAKAIDGTFPDWRSVVDGAAGELQLIGMPEIEPRVPLSAVEMCTKALGCAPIVEMAEDRVKLTVADQPEFTAIAMLLKADTLPKGFAYETGDWERPLAYLTDLATSAGLPQFSHEIDRIEYPEEAQVWDSRRRRHRPSVRAEGIKRVETIVDARLAMRDGLVMGATFGRDGYAMVEEPDYETLTVRSVARYVGSDHYQDGSYSVAMPRDRQGMAAAVTIGTPGVDERAVATKNGAILLDAAAISRLAGDPADWARVEIEPIAFHHGRRLPDGFALPEPMMTATEGKGGRSKRRRMSDREALASYTADPAGTAAALQPKPTVAATMAIEAIVELAKACSGWHDAAEPDVDVAAPSAAIIPFPVERRAAEIAAETEAEPPSAETEPDAPVAEPEIPPVEAAPAAEADLPVDMAEIASTAPQAAPAVPIKPDREVTAAMIDALQDRIARLEALANNSGTQPEANSAAPPAAQLLPDNNFTRERRLRIVRRYLAMRRKAATASRCIETLAESREQALLQLQDEQGKAARADRLARLGRFRSSELIEALRADRAKVAAAEKRAEDAEFAAADLARQLETATATAAAATARADAADGRWQIIVDEKQAIIVALQNEKIEQLSGGRIKLTTPLRANASPVWPASAHGRA